MKKATCVIYARVSTKGQEREGYSIPAQLDLLRLYAKEKDLQIVEEFVEAETAKCAGRTKFNDMLKYLKKSKNCKTILVEKTDRLYRNLSDYVTIDNLALELHFVKEGCIISDKSHSSEKFMHLIKVGMARQYIQNLSEETQKGRKKKIEEGYFIGQVPYGYKKLNPRTTVLDNQKSKFVKRAFELYAKEDISLRALRNKLYDEGFIYTPSSSKVTTSQLENMLKNECYTGMLKYNGKLYQGKHPAIVSNRLFLKAQQAFRKDNKPKKCDSHDFLYSGLLVCGECGRAITCEIKYGKWIYYHCTGNYGKCGQKSIYIREEKIDKQIDDIFSNINIPEKFADYLNKLLETSFKNLQVMTKEKFNYIKTEIDKTQTRRNKLLELYMDGQIDKKTWSEKSLYFEEQLTNLQNQLNTQKSKGENFINEGKKIIEVVKHTPSLYLKQNIQEKHKMLKILLSKCTLKDGKLSYEYNRPFSYFAKINKSNKKLPRLDSNQQPFD